jgi:hypothetical protein
MYRTFAGRLSVLAGMCVVAASAQAAEIVLEHSAVDKLLTQSLFTNAGRFDLRQGICYAYLESPSVELKGGRIRIRSHLTSRVGVEVGGSCVGTDFAAWTVVSGRPVADAGKVKLVDLHIDNVDDAATRLLLESGLLTALPGAFEFDVLQAVRTMLQGSRGQFQASVDAFDIDSVTAGDDKLSVKFDFKLVAR